MRVYLSLILILLPVYICSFDLGGALSVDYFNNPIEDSAPSPIQQRPILFHNLDIGIFNLRTGFGIVEGFYEITDELPVFNDMYSGFYTLEFDVFTYPGLSFNISKSVSLGIAGGGGVRLPVLTKVDDGITEDEANDSFNWFYSENRFIYWGAEVFSSFKLPLSDTIRFFVNVHYRDFLFRDDQWIIGATTGIVWPI